MADHNISIDVQVKNQEALNILKQIRDTLNSIKSDNSLKITIQDNFKQVQSDLEGIRKDMNDIGQKQLKIDASGFESVVQTLQNGFDDILKKMDEIGKKRTRPKVDKSDIDAAAQSAEKLNTALEKVNRTRQMPSAGPGTALDLYTQLGAPRPSQYWGPKRLTGSGPKRIGYSDIIDGVNYTIYDAETGEPLLLSGPVKTKLSREELYGLWGGRLGKAATGLNIASSVSSALGDFGGGMASAVGGMSNMFSFDTVGTAKRYLTAMATRAITGQIGGIIQRYDIMNTFSDYMQLAGVSETIAQASLDRVDQSIRGIPIGLDEAAFRLRKYQMYMGDIDRATNFTIGIQKAITAGGASEQMKTTAYTQIDRLLATGKLGQSRQWLSLFNGMGVSLRFLKEELGLGEDADLKTVAADLASGAISTESFIRAVERLANNSGLDEALTIYKGTVEAWQANINNAIKRGGQNIMESFNSVMEDSLGYGITGVMKKIRDGIDVASKEAGDYIQDNPGHVKTIRGAVETLFDKVLSIDGGRLVDNIVKNIGGLAEAIGIVFDRIPKGFLEDFIGFATTWAGPLSALMKGAQSGLGVVLGVFDKLNKMDMKRLVSQITREIERMAKVVSGLLSALPNGLLGNLMAFGLVWGKPVAKVLSGIASAMNQMSVAAAAMSLGMSGGIWGKILTLLMNPALLATLGGVAAAVGLIAVGIGKANDAMLEHIEERHLNARELLKIDDFEQSLEEYNTLNETIKQSAKSYQDDIASIQGNAETTKELIGEIFDLYAELEDLNNNPELKGERSRVLKELADDLEKLKALEPGINLDQLLTGNIDPGAAKDLEQLANAYVDMVTAEAQSLAARDALEEAYAQKSSARRAREESEEWVSFYKSQYWRYDQTVKALQKEYGKDDFTNTGYGQDEAGRVSVEEQEALTAAIELRNQANNSLKDAEEGAKTAAEAEAEADKTINQVTDDLRESIKVKEGINEADLTPVLSDEAKAAQETAVAISDLAQSYLDLKENAEESLKSQIDLLKELNTEAEKGLADTTANVEGNVARVQQQNQFAHFIQDWLNNPNNGMTSQGRDAIAWLAAEYIKSGNNQALGELAGLSGLTDENGNYTTEYYQKMAELWPKIINHDVDGILEDTADLQAQFETYDIMGGKLNEANQYIQEGKASMDGAADASASINENDPSGTIQATGEAAEEATGPTEELAGATQQVATNAQQASSNSDSMKGSVIHAGAAALMQSVSMLMFSGSLSSVASQATHAFTQVSALAGAISRLQNKEITIKINVLGSLGRLAKGGMAGFYASGGNVSLGFPGMATGTDTIPAWLTPGEYVMRRAAVGLFGSRFMDRVNKMDIGGAFDALMTRISNPMMHGNTYNRDNHATVNNYFYGDNGQNYSQHKAYKWAGSL